MNVDDLIVLDFETYYAPDYTLRGTKGMSIVEYVRDPRFLIHVCSISVGGEKPHHHRAEELPTIFGIIDWTKVVAAHHCQFEAFILSEKYRILVRRPECTMALSQYVHQGAIENDLDTVAKHEGLKGKDLTALDAVKGKRELTPEEFEGLGGYCDQDVADTLEVYKRYRPRLPDAEAELMHMVINMFAQPRLYVNESLAREAMDEEILERDALIAATGFTEKQLSSSAKFAKILTDMGIEPPMKISPRTKKPTYAFSKTDFTFQQFAASENEILRGLYHARIAAKSTTGFTKAARLLRNTAGGKTLPIYYRYWGGHTGRLSGGDKLNPQAFKRKSKHRRAIIASPHRTDILAENPEDLGIGVADSAQIEARLLAELAGQEDLVEAFRQGVDIYSEFAGKNIYNRYVNRKTVETDFIAGFVGKVAVLGLGFQMGPPKFRNTLAVGALGGPPVFLDPGMEYKIVSAYRHRYPMIVKMWGTAEQALLAMCMEHEFTYKMLFFSKDGVLLPNGTWLRYPDLHLDHNNNFVYRCGPREWTTIYGGKFVENLVQALARIVVTTQTIEINKRYPVVMSTHDEAAALIRRAERVTGVQFMLDTMSIPPEWMPNLPLAAEGGWDTCYSK